MPRIVAIELLTYWFVRAECSTADEPGQVARIGGLSNFGKVSKEKQKEKPLLPSFGRRSFNMYHVYDSSTSDLLT